MWDLGALPPTGSPPSTYAGYGVVKGEAGAWPRFAGLTLFRAAMIAPGLAVAGVEPRKLPLAALLASVGVSVSVVAYTWWSTRDE